MIKELLPASIKELEPLVEAVDRVAIELSEGIANNLIYSRIEELSEQVLDLLAWQFHIEGYELAINTEEKRNLIKNAIELHKHKGTKYAVQKVLEALNIDGQIREWFEYNGQPYTFKAELGITNREITTELRDKLIGLINQYKNVRSHLEEILLAYLSRHTAVTYAGTMAESYSECEFITKIEQLLQTQGYLYTGTMAESYGYARFETW